MFGNDDDGSDENYDDAGGSPQETITGIVITNNSYHPIKTLDKILVGYSSTKGSDAGLIGQNGIGLKQGCAQLSDLSFVLVRRGDANSDDIGAAEFSLGLIARQLQRVEGTCLPSIEFGSKDFESLEEEMLTVFARTAVGECVAKYGADSLEIGVKRLVSHFRQLSSLKDGGWGPFSEVFRVIVHEALMRDDSVGTDANDMELKKDDFASIDANDMALSLLDEIKSALPSTYIHIPKNLEVKVNDQTIHFTFYQTRLVELTAFYQRIDPKKPVGSDGDWQNPENGYLIRLLIGFDCVREEKEASIYIHSRHSGRLVTKYDDDARGKIGLPTGSTDFCQGLTVIVDDMHGHLPLNPTKQGIAFAKGRGIATSVHEKNLNKWIGAYAHLFYNIHMKRRFGDSKNAFTIRFPRVTAPWSGMDLLVWMIVTSRSIPEFRGYL